MLLLISRTVWTMISQFSSRTLTQNVIFLWKCIWRCFSNISGNIYVPSFMFGGLIFAGLPVFQRQPIRVPGNRCVQWDLDGPAPLLTLTNERKAGKCRRLDVWKTVVMTTDAEGDWASPESWTETERVTFGRQTDISCSCWTGLLEHDALVRLYNYCLLRFLVCLFFFYFVKIRAFGLKKPFSINSAWSGKVVGRW